MAKAKTVSIASTATKQVATPTAPATPAKAGAKSAKKAGK